MGCGKQAPSYSPPPPPQLPTAQELFMAATNFGKTNSPMAYGAREGALNDLNRGNDYYSEFQPTSFEQALANQQFQNIFPDVQKNIRGNLSLSGMESSPVLARLSGKAYGDLSTQIGEFLSTQGNNRANYSLASRLNIDPFSTYGNYLSTDTNQQNSQASLNYDYQQQLAQQDYQNALKKYQNQQALYRTVGMLSPVGGAIYGGVSGGSEGFSSSLGGTLSTAQAALPFMMGAASGGTGGAAGAAGAGSGFGWQDALWAGNMFKGQPQSVYQGPKSGSMDWMKNNAFT